MNYLHKILVQYMVRAGLMLCVGPDEDVVTDRRSAIEAAFEVEEKKGGDSSSTPPPPPAPAPAPAASPAPTSAPAPATLAKDAPSPGQEGVGKKPAVPDAADGKASAMPPPPEPGDEPVFAVDKPPQSWRAPQRAKWEKLDPDVRQEIIRRERETTRVLGEAGQARQLTAQFTHTVAPYQARIQSMGVTPLAAVSELFKADYILSTAPKVQKAQLMAKLISDYGIDVVELDNALSGKPPTDPVDARVEQLLQERLKPIQQFLTTQQQRQQEQEHVSQHEVNQTLEKMAIDPKYPHFEDVRQDMADVIDLSAKRGVYLSLDQAYNRAIAMNPEVSKQVAAQQESEAKRTSVQAAHARAQKALNASSSVGGAPGGVPGGASASTDRRTAIAAAFDSMNR